MAPGSDVVFTFQTFSDQKDANAEKKAKLTRVLVGTLEELFDELSRLNKAGAGIFVTVNKTQGERRSAKDVTALRAVFADKDDGNIPPTCPLMPSMIVQSRRGEHPYWILKADQDVRRFTPIQKLVIQALQSDSKIHDLSRVMRLPGFYHMKDSERPFMVRIKSITGVTYTLDQIADAFGPAEKFEGLERFRDFQHWVDGLSPAEAAVNPHGGRNATLLLVAREGLAAGLDNDTIRAAMASYASRSGETDTDIDELLSRQRKQHGETPFKSALFQGQSDPKKSAADIADSFLSERGFIRPDGMYILRFWKEEAYRYNPGTGSWRKWDRSDLKAEVIRFLQADPKTRTRAKGNFASDVIANMAALTLIPTNTLVPCFLSSIHGADQFILMNNGILKLSDFLAGGQSSLLPHTPEFFSTAALPFPHDAAATAPAWIKFLDRMIPDVAVQALLQEWFGYCLIFDVSQQKFVLLIGEGANGKTVICVVLRCLLGSENVSAVALEQFNPVRTFPLAATDGKLANVVEEIGEMNKTEEGVLKNFVSGGQFTVERKHRDPFEFYPTARLTFASNVLPRFSDRSDGLWRRLLPIPLTVQILDESQQDKRLVSPEHWVRSGELPGILNWALEGLKRLRARGQFLVPEACREAREQYKRDANPAGEFLDETCVACPKGRISSHELYVEYSRWMEMRGMKPLGETQFAKEVKRRFPMVTQSPNALRFGHNRCRAWVGLDWQPAGRPGPYVVTGPDSEY